MINYAETKRGDILQVVGLGALGYAKNGELVRVVEVHSNAVEVENKDGEKVDFLFHCGAARLAPTEHHADFDITA